MRNIKIIISFVALIMVFNACNEDFLNRTPLDEVGEVDYFKTPADLEVYVNTFYTNSSFPISAQFQRDYDSDNAVQTNHSVWLEGSRTLDAAGGIGFGNVRNINYFFDNYKKVEENYDFEEYKQFVGEAHFFKAIIYFDLLERYGDIQWLNSALGTESPELYNPRDPRNVVADNIIAHLDTAAMYLTPDKTDGASRVNKWMALLMQSRVALFEGTWQKYHTGTDFGVDNAQPDKYFNKAVEATTAIMNSKLYDIYSTGATESDYRDLFILRDYAGNSEVMFWKKYDDVLGKSEAVFRRNVNYYQQFPNEHSITKQLADSYLCMDGNPISVSDDFQGFATLEDEMQNRDPRYYQTIATPDAVWRINGDGTIDYYSDIYDKLNEGGVQYNSPGGYIVMKGYNPETQYHEPQTEETPGIVYRYAEVLLNYAEAKAELNTITQEDMDKSINVLRDRVGMPHLMLGSITADPNWNFPELSPVINEIRRERRVELALEGLRALDIKRWAAADELIVGQRPKGFLAAQLNENPYPVDKDGFLDPYQNRMPNGYQFQLDRDYLDAIPKTQRALNPDVLTQNPGWEE